MNRIDELLTKHKNRCEIPPILAGEHSHRTKYEIFTVAPNLVLNRETIILTMENDLVLIYLEDKPLAFARIESILPDEKKDWYHVKLLLLQVPLQVVTWILKDVYVNGTEFTMNGKRMRLEKVERPDEPEASDPPEDPETKSNQPQNEKGAKVISLKDLKRK